MEEKLFYAYLKYQKENMKNVWANLLKLHWSVLVPFIVSVVSMVCTLVLTLTLPLCVWHWICVAAMVSGYIALMYTTENFQIRCSHEKFAKYCEYCADMKKWLAEFSIDSAEKVVNIKERISQKASNLRNSYEKTTSSVSKWLEGFAFPIVIAVISAITAGDGAAEEKVTTAVAIIMILILGWYISSVVSKIVNHNRKRMIEQLECFASDLQGVVDTQFEGGIAYQNKAGIESDQ